MSALDQLFLDAPEPAGCHYLPLVDVVAMTGPHGRYLKLICTDDTELPIEAIVDQRHFPLFEPYFAELRASRTTGDDNWPIVPVYKTPSGTWRFSWVAASQAHPNLRPPEGDPDLNVVALEERAYRMQVSVPGALARRFKRAAAARGVRHTDLLLALIRDAAT